MLNRHGFSLHSAGVTGGSPEHFTTAFFRGVLLKDLLESASPGRGYQPLREATAAVNMKKKLHNLCYLRGVVVTYYLANPSSLGSRGTASRGRTWDFAALESHLAV